jgi:hypothetical protein
VRGCLSLVSSACQAVPIGAASTCSTPCDQFHEPARLMRRPSIACRRAVQSLQTPLPQHIWISDDLLASTFRQFFRSSCRQQKRHGSHVPGPLEARRRAAKRRMSLSVNDYPQDSFPSSFNLGALFGFGRSSSQPSWRYEPPSLQRDTSEPLDTCMAIRLFFSRYT